MSDRDIPSIFSPLSNPVLSNALDILEETKTETDIGCLGGVPMFCVDDLNESGLNLLDMIIRQLMVEKNITTKGMSNLYRHWANKVGEMPSNISSDINNLKSTLRTGNISNKTYMRTLAILGYDAYKLTLSLSGLERNEIEIEATSCGGVQSVKLK